MNKAQAEARKTRLLNHLMYNECITSYDRQKIRRRTKRDEYYVDDRKRVD